MHSTLTFEALERRVAAVTASYRRINDPAVRPIWTAVDARRSAELADEQARRFRDGAVADRRTAARIAS